MMIQLENENDHSIKNVNENSNLKCIVKLLWKYYKNIAKVLQHYCENIMKILRK